MSRTTPGGGPKKVRFFCESVAGPATPSKKHGLFCAPPPPGVVLDIGEGQLSQTFGGGERLRLTFFGGVQIGWCRQPKMQNTHQNKRTQGQVSASSFCDRYLCQVSSAEAENMRCSGAAQVVGWCHDQDDGCQWVLLCPSFVCLHLLLVLQRSLFWSFRTLTDW